MLRPGRDVGGGGVGDWGTDTDFPEPPPFTTITTAR